jgi:hypothetical protein
MSGVCPLSSIEGEFFVFYSGVVSAYKVHVHPLDHS